MSCLICGPMFIGKCPHKSLSYKEEPLTDSYRKKLDEAAKSWAYGGGSYLDGHPIEHIDSFVAGTQFVLDNPPPEVEALVEAAEMAKYKLEIYRANSDGIYHGGVEYMTLVKIIDEALAPFRKGE